MKSFLKYTLATLLGLFLFSILSSLFFFGILGIMMSSREKPVTVKPHSVLYYKLRAFVPERTLSFPLFGSNPFSFDMTPAPGLNDILADIHKAKEDDNITGIYIEAGMSSPGIGTIEEIRNALLDFKQSGKFVLVYCPDLMLQSAYYLATAADTIYLNPAGAFQFTGMRSEIMYYKKALEKIGVEVQVVKHGKFKSAVEPFIRKNMSPENREQIRIYMNSIWNHILKKISVARGITVQQLNDLADRLAIDSPEAAVKYKLIDGVRYKDQVLDELKEKSGYSGKNVRFISLSKYTKVPARKHGSYSKNKVAVIYAFGDIVMGAGNETNIGDKRFAKAIRKARLDTNVKAIVLRVNSPGGSALASDIIWREVKLAHQVKPVVASMGNYAASGGYYILSSADTIFTHPVTLTGSIGVFGLIPNAGKLLEDKLGITFDVEKTNKYADFGSIYRPLSSGEKAFLSVQIENTYKTFVNHVSQGRHLRASYVDSIGQGRVWSGINAVENGLADTFGGLYDAINAAAQMAHLDNYRTITLPVVEDPYQKLIKQLTGDVRMRTIPHELRGLYQTWKVIMDTKNRIPVMTRLPYEINVY
ncbi:MAG TPA: signal peptide peptidase SppA [Bacteroidetes bacterium]|nr:signal peptide peptidase SppA [Bacteroidota bacterium]